MDAASRSADSPIRCRVCGCAELSTDEVLDLGWLLLAECPRCDHRFTRRCEPQVHRVRRVFAFDHAVASAA